jgi:hypothetical protein
MADNKKFHKHEHKNDRQFKPEQIELTEEDKWNPTPEAFKAFQVRDEELATSNVRSVLGSRQIPISLKEIKDSTLHSSDVIERVLTAGLAACSILEIKGKYTLPTRVVIP